MVLYFCDGFVVCFYISALYNYGENGGLLGEGGMKVSATKSILKHLMQINLIVMTMWYIEGIKVQVCNTPRSVANQQRMSEFTTVSERL